MTSQPNPGNAGTPTLTVTDLANALHTARSALTGVTALIDDLDRWVDQLPRHHRPDPEPTLLVDFVPTTDPDPTTGERAISDVLDAITSAAQTASRVSTDLTAATAQAMVTFPVPVSNTDQPEVGTVPVMAYLDPTTTDEDFEKQRKAVRRALTYHPRTQTWHGELPRDIHAEPHRWQALVDVTDAGGGVSIQL